MPRPVALLLCSALAAAPLHGQAALAAAARFGSNGLGVEGNARFGTIGLRAGANFFSWSFRHRASSVSFNAELDFKGKSAILDFYPGGGAFHLSGGVTTAPVEVDGTGRPNFGGSYIFNGRQYPTAAVGTVVGHAEWPDLMPYVGLGLGGPGKGKNPVGLILDLGVAIGTPSFTMSASGATPGSQLEADVAAERDEIQAELDKWGKVYPVVALGIIVRF